MMIVAATRKWALPQFIWNQGGASDGLWQNSSSEQNETGAAVYLTLDRAETVRVRE